jgi:hypothetical protein
MAAAVKRVDTSAGSWGESLQLIRTFIEGNFISANVASEKINETSVILLSEKTRH